MESHTCAVSTEAAPIQAVSSVAAEISHLTIINVDLDFDAHGSRRGDVLDHDAANLRP